VVGDLDLARGYRSLRALSSLLFPFKSMWDVLAESGEPLLDETANEPTALTAAPH
jgi:hypothetical protein